MMSSVITSQKEYQEITAKLYAEERKELEALLTPEELFEYELRKSPTANKVRAALSSLDVTEAEFRVVFAVEHAGGAGAMNMANAMDPKRPLSDPAVAAYREKLRAALGAERYAELEIVSEPSNQRVALLMKRLNLPISTLVEANSIRNGIVERAKAVARNTSLTPEQQKSQYQSLAAEAKTALSHKLGGVQGYEEYIRIKDSWIRDLESGQIGK